MQPEHVPITATESVRPSHPLPPPQRWSSHRPSDLGSRKHPVGLALGDPGSDQGYALKLAERFHGKLLLAHGEQEHDCLAAITAVALRRASIFGRSPVIYDIHAAINTWGLAGNPPKELVEYRKGLFIGAAEDYWCRRRIASIVPEGVLRLSPESLLQRQHDWRALLQVDQ